ncbi:class I SAM-dependent methyltransferase [Acinetobacter sp. ANC 4779]|uniref:class I SAM-dependent methyltransferase n=1 Tax=Acinetobacter sp. ANC 4779 TaxID=2529848 RepID=UPI0010408359|nr:methyltransferase domain-containing protein [Acinetobacter sp. ANC 4779]TCB48942.1 class I SAM-dependent methyltransferase [Acinetobacter sp. ANC 4779]
MIYKFYHQHIFPHLLNQVMQTPSLMDQRRELLLPISGEVLEIGFGTGVNLPFADHSIEHIVSTWTLCSIENLTQALNELHRVLKPTGTLHLVEHVQYQDNNTLRHLQNLLTPIQKRLADGCHLNRNIEQALLDANFRFKEQHYFDATGIPKIGRRMLFARVQKQQKRSST